MTDPNGARLRALDAINPDDEGFRDALAGGVTTVVVKPGSGNPIGGQTVAVKSWGRTVDDMLVREPVSVKSALGENPKRVYGEQKKLPSTRLGVAAVIRDAFTKAQDYRKARASGATARASRSTATTPWRSWCGCSTASCRGASTRHRADDIATAIRLSEEFGYRLIVNHGTEGHLLADLLAEKGIPVIIGPLLVGRSKVEVRERHAAQPRASSPAPACEIALTTDHPVVPIDFLVHQATFAVKEGLDTETALRSITVNPARIMGLDDRVGALKPGLDARHRAVVGRPAGRDEPRGAGVRRGPRGLPLRRGNRAGRHGQPVLPGIRALPRGRPGCPGRPDGPTVWL